MAKRKTELAEFSRWHMSTLSNETARDQKLYDANKVRLNIRRHDFVPIWHTLFTTVAAWHCLRLVIEFR